jgi:hypothetical protein
LIYELISDKMASFDALEFSMSLFDFARLARAARLMGAALFLPLPLLAQAQPSLRVSTDFVESAPLAPGEQARLLLSNPSLERAVEGLRVGVDGGPGWSLAWTTCRGRLAPRARCEAAVWWNPPPGTRRLSRAAFEAQSQGALSVRAPLAGAADDGSAPIGVGLMLMAQTVGAERFEPGSSSRLRVFNASSRGALSGLKVHLQGGSGWRLRSTTCQKTLPARQACEAVVAWNPKPPRSADSRSELVVSSSSPSATASLSLFGAAPR